MSYAVLVLGALLSAGSPIPYEAEIDAALAETADIYAAPKALVVAVISVESGELFDPRRNARRSAASVRSPSLR